jgi:hypothetical protein
MAHASLDTSRIAASLQHALPRIKRWILPLAVMNLAVYLLWLASTWPLGFDARAYLTAAQAVVDGTRLIDLAHPERLGWASAEDTPPYLYPPLLAILCVPLTFVAPSVAHMVWFVTIVAVSLLLIPLLRPFVGWRIAVLGVLLFAPTWRSAWLGQINAVIALTYALALLATQRKQMGRAGGWLMIGALFKLVPAIALLVLAARRSWYSLLAAGLIGGSVFALSLPVVGVAPWRDGVLAAAVVPWRLRSMFSWPGQASYWLGDPGVVLGYAITAMLLISTLVRAPKVPPLLALSAAIILPLLIARVTWDHHALMALPALAVLWQWSRRGQLLAISTWLLLTTINDITMPIMLTLCWAACCWPHLLEDSATAHRADNILAQPPQPQHML